MLQYQLSKNFINELPKVQNFLMMNPKEKYFNWYSFLRINNHIFNFTNFLLV